MKKKRNIVFGILALILVVAAVIVFTSSKSTDIVYRTVKLERGDISVVVTATGTLSADTTVQVGTQVSGTVAKLYADFNSVVKKGRVIAVIDTTFLQTQVQDAEANLEGAVAKVNQTQRDLKRTEDLFKKSLASQADYDAAKTDYESAVATQKSAQAALDRARINLKYATIRAPIDGVVISRNVDVGQTVAASLAAPVLFMIANDLTKMQVQANIDEADIGKIRVGQDVKFTVDAYPDQQFQGKVGQIRLQPNVIQNVVNYTVIVEAPNPDLKLMPGMTATITVLVDRRDNALKLPNLALRFQPDQKVLDSLRQARASDSTRGRGMDSTRWKGVDSTRRAEMRARFSAQQRQGGGGPGLAGLGAGGGRGGFGGNRSLVWILDENKKLNPVSVRLGLSDGTSSEIVDSRLKEGDEVVVGVVSDVAKAPQASNPLGGGGRRF
ncbi:MAG: efflux RND transporter periplasmic adaptor subunit [Bacteroidota bacterium]